MTITSTKMVGVSRTPRDLKLQILHTNDMHARFEEANHHGGRCTDKEGCGRYGGFARVKRAVDDAKEEARLTGYSSVFLNAGDTFQGTAHYTLFKWEIVAQLIDALGLDVMCLGNHEFDDGINDLRQYLETIKTPVVCTNLNLTRESQLNVPNLRTSYTLEVDGVTIGVIGYLTPETKEISATEDLEIFDETCVRTEVQRLKEKGINIIIALGHAGFKRDIEIAKAIPEISIIIGGHSHSLLHTRQEGQKTADGDRIEAPYPYVVMSETGRKTIILQAYKNTKYLGKLKVTFDSSGNPQMFEGNTILLDAKIEKDQNMQQLVSEWSLKIDQKLDKRVGHSKVFLGKHNPTIGQYESNLGNLITDAFVDYAVNYFHERETDGPWTEAPIGIIQSKGIRIEMERGDITARDVLMTLPFGNRLCVATYKGCTIKKALEFAFSSQNHDDEEKSILFVSGLRVTYCFGDSVEPRTKSITVIHQESSMLQYCPLEMDREYNIILTEYMAGGGDRFEMLRNERLDMRHFDTKITDADAVQKYLEKLKIVYPPKEDRISVEGPRLAPTRR